MTALTYRVYVDWDGDAQFSGDPLDNVTDRTLSEQGVQVEHGRDQIRQFGPPMVPTAAFVLDNEDRRYSPEYPGSPLSGQVLPGRLVQIELWQGSDITNYDAAINYDLATKTYDGVVLWPLFSGVTDELEQAIAFQERRVSVRCLGQLQQLRGLTVSTALHENVLTSTAIHRLLDAAGFDDDLRDVSLGSTSLIYWWLDEEDAFEAMLDLLASEGAGAAIYESADGRLHFEGRAYRSTQTRSTTSQVTLAYNPTGAELYYADPSYDPNFKQVITRARYTVKRRSVAVSATKVWEYGSGLTLTANEERKILARPSDPFKEAVTPASGTDFNVTAGSFSTAPQLDRTSGGNATITMVAGSSGVTIDKLELRAKAITTLAEMVMQSTVDVTLEEQKYRSRILRLGQPRSRMLTGAAARFEIPVFDIGGRPDLDPNSAQDLCNGYVTQYKEPRPTMVVALESIDDPHLIQQLKRRVSDRVTVRDHQTGVDTDFFIERIEHALEQLGAVHRTAWHLEKAISVPVFLWDDPASVWDTATWGV